MKGLPTDFWAKLEKDERGQVIGWHPLLHHSAEVAAVMEVLLQRTLLRKRLAKLAGWDDLEPGHVARLCILAVLHDSGKTNHGFQDQAFSWKGPRCGHVKPIIDLVYADVSLKKQLVEAIHLLQVAGWFCDPCTLEAFLLATWGHHGKPVRSQEVVDLRLWTPTAKRNPIEGIANLWNHAERWFPEAFDAHLAPFPDTSAFGHAFNGILTVADWLGSDRQFFEYADSDADPMPDARRRALNLAAELYLDADNARRSLNERPAGYEEILDGGCPYPIQQACLDLTAYPDGSLTILESDTGSGKTEMAIARFLILYQLGLVDGMYFALPTRTAAQQLYRRVVAMVGRVFTPDTPPPVVQAVPGYIKVDDVDGAQRRGFEVLWDDDVNAIRGWAAEHPKRYLIGSIVVGTIDQVLLSNLQIKHAHMRAGALLRHFLVVDEVHASDLYMNALLGGVLKNHLDAGGHALLMSATLGVASRVRLISGGATKVPPLEEAVAAGYPMLTHVGANRERPETIVAASSGRTKKANVHTRSIASDPDEVAALGLQHAHNGARVLIIRNRVLDCIATQRALEAGSGKDSRLLFGVEGMSAPHHARFADPDRKVLDLEIEKVYGKHSEQTGVVAVTTQTVEISLDIDADILITDLCPIDVLLQRIGRLHRHERQRPDGYSEPGCIVLVPAERNLGSQINAQGEGRGPHGLGTVYPDLRVLEATWRLLEADRKTWGIPEDNRYLVEHATHPEILDALTMQMGEPWDLHARLLKGIAFANAGQARLVCLDRSKPFGESEFVSDEMRVMTRLGNDDVEVELPQAQVGPFGKMIHRLAIRLRDLGQWGELLGDKNGLLASDITQMQDGFTFAVGGKPFRYSHLGLEKVNEPQ